MAATVASKRRRPLALYLLTTLLLFQGGSALFGGYGLVADPSGSGLQLPVDWLAGTPFRDYLLPGLILLVVLGVFPIVTVLALWSRPTLPGLAGLEHLVGAHWSWLASLLVGLALVIWIAVQGLMLGFGHPLQWSYLSLGIGILGLSLFPSVRRYFARPGAADLKR